MDHLIGTCEKQIVWFYHHIEGYDALSLFWIAKEAGGDPQGMEICN